MRSILAVIIALILLTQPGAAQIVDYKQAMERALIEFSESAYGAEWAVVYFAGHGIEMDGRNYLIPVDARLRMIYSQPISKTSDHPGR